MTDSIIRHTEEFWMPTTDLDLVERTFTGRETLPRWVSPLARFESVGEWAFERGARFNVSYVYTSQPLVYEVVRRTRTADTFEILFRFTGFVKGSDRWTFTLEGDQIRGVEHMVCSKPEGWLGFAWDWIGKPMSLLELRVQCDNVRRLVTEAAGRRP